MKYNVKNYWIMNIFNILYIIITQNDFKLWNQIHKFQRKKKKTDLDLRADISSVLFG